VAWRHLGDLRGRRSASVRFQVTMVSLVVVGVTILLVGTVLVVFIQASLQHNLQSTLSREVSTTGVQVSQSGLPPTLNSSPGTVLQITTLNGTVVLASPEITGLPAVSHVHPPLGQVVQIPASNVFAADQGSELAVATTVLSTHYGTLVIYGVASSGQIQRSVRLLELSLAIAGPLVLLMTGTLAWWLCGRALRPVEAMRREVADISSTALDRRVPRPDTGDEIDRLAETMNEMLSRLERSAEDQRRFISNASHELRSPLASMLTQVEVAQAHPEGADWPRLLTVVADEGHRLHRLVDDLFLLARSDEHQLRIERRDVDLDELVLAEARRLRLAGSVQVDAKSVAAARITGDPELLSRVVRNLVDNAERYAASTVRFEVSTTEDVATVVIADDGPGVDPEVAPRIFDRFSRADAARARLTGGTGLGLAIVHDIVAAHGGQVRLEPSARGARFVVELPVDGPAGASADHPD